MSEKDHHVSELFHFLEKENLPDQLPLHLYTALHLTKDFDCMLISQDHIVDQGVMLFIVAYPHDGHLQVDDLQGENFPVCIVHLVHLITFEGRIVFFAISANQVSEAW